MALRFNFSKDDTENKEKDDFNACYARIDDVPVDLKADKAFINIWIYNSDTARQVAGSQPKIKIQIAGTLDILDLGNLDMPAKTAKMALLTNAYAYLKTTPRFSAALDV